MSDRYTGPVQLARFRFNDGDYFADLRLREFRPVDNPGVRIEFVSSRGRQLCQMAGVVTCSSCGVSMIVSSKTRSDGVRCVRCGCGVEQ